MESVVAQMPVWLVRLAWTAGTVGAAWVAGLVVRGLMSLRGGRAAPGDQGWDEALVREIRQRVPFWSVLIGLYLSLSYWPLSAEAYRISARALSAIGVLSATFAAAAVATRLAAAYGPRVTPSGQVSGLTQNIARIVVMVLGALVIVKSLGYDITPMVAALGVGGLAVALALQEPLSSLFAGIFISVAGQVRLGDYLRLDTGAEGYLVDLNWRSATLRQLSDNMIVIPNSKLAQAMVTNFSLPSPELGLGVEFVVDRRNDLDAVERAALDVAATVVRDVPGAVPAAPSVRFQGLTDRGVRMSIGVRVRSFQDQAIVQHELVKRLHVRFAADGVRLR